MGFADTFRASAFVAATVGYLATLNGDEGEFCIVDDKRGKRFVYVSNDFFDADERWEIASTEKLKFRALQAFGSEKPTFQPDADERGWDKFYDEMSDVVELWANEIFNGYLKKYAAT